jgi:hypothetical protein
MPGIAGLQENYALMKHSGHQCCTVKEVQGGFLGKIYKNLEKGTIGLFKKEVAFSKSFDSLPLMFEGNLKG